MCLFFSAGRAANQPISEDGFWEQVRQTRAWLDEPHSPAEWAAQSQKWKEMGEISLPGGQSVAVDTSEIVRRMAADAPDIRQLQAALASLEEGRQRWVRADCGDCKAGLLAEILARPEFAAQSQGQNPIQKFFQQLAEAFLKWMDSFFNLPGGSVKIPPLVFEIVIAAVLVLILYIVFRDVFASLAGEAELAGEEAGENQALTASLASQKARLLSGSGDYRSAMRFMYLAALLHLDERGLLRYNRSLTNREYLLQVRGRPDLESSLKEIVAEFDRVWYGFQPVDQDQYARYAGQVAALEEIKQ